MRSSLHPRTALALALLVSLPCWAQEAPGPEPLPGFDLERLEANPGRGTLLLSSGELMVPGGLRLMVLGNYQMRPLVLLNQEHRLEAVQHRVVGLLSGTYAALSWLEVGAQLPVVLWQDGANLASANLASPASQGLGTPLLRARVGLLSQRAEQPVNLAVDVGLGLPLGSTSALARDAGLRFHSRVVLGGQLGVLRPSLEAGVLLHPSVALGPQGQPRVGGPEIQVGAGLSTVGTGLGAELSARAALPAGSTQTSVEVLGGLRFPVSPGLELFVTGGPGVGAMPGTPRLRMVLGLAYTDEPPPRLEFIEDSQPPPLHLATQRTEQGPAEQPGAQGRPSNTWEFQALTFTEAEGAPSPPTPPEEEAASLGAQPMPSGPPADSQQPFRPGPRERLVLRGTVLFEHASAELPASLPLLERVALLLQEMPESATVIIEGHTDAEGTYTFNRFLSLRRAQAVWRHLVSRGMPGGRLDVRGFGSNWPVSSNASEEGRRLNRRVEIFVLAEPGLSGVSMELPP